MNAHYHYNTLQWYQSCQEEPVTMGGEKRFISYCLPGPDSVDFDLRLKQAHMGPLIGIMTARKPSGSVAGNGSLFIELQKKLISVNGISFIFTLDGVGQETIDGFTFLPDKKDWIKIRFPYPDLVYNRIPFRKVEQNEQHQRFFLSLKEKSIPFFNPCFIDKFELYCLLEDHPILKHYLPKTILATHPKALAQFIKKHQGIYLKPAQSSQGIGIYRVKAAALRQIELEGINERKTYRSFQNFWNHWEAVLKEKNYLAQEEINPAHFHGKRFDFRILAHAEYVGYSVTGVGIRQSQKQELTTHIPTGGRLLPYQLIQTNEHDQFIQTVVSEIGKALTSAFGYFGEFSIDAGISVTGKYYIYEINAKPMSFDEPEIEMRKMDQLCRLFLQLTDFE